MPTLLKTRLGVTNDECYTPKWIFDQLKIAFDLDVCAPKTQTHVPAQHKYTIDHDGLKSEWFGNVWMNPPYSKPGPWVARFMHHANGIALLPTSTGKWQLQLWQDPQCKWVMLAPLKFEHYTRPLPTRCYLVGYGKTNIEALQHFGLVR